MCRSIHTLYHINPPASEEEVHAAALQYVRKISGYSKPSKVNEAEFLRAVSEIEAVSSRLIAALQTDTLLRDRSMMVRSRD